MRQISVCLILAAVLIGCSNPEKLQSRLSVACAVKKCECVATEGVFFTKSLRQEVLWQSNGDAYCPEGFALAELPQNNKAQPGGLKMPRYTDPVACYDTPDRCNNKEQLKRLQ